MHAKNNSELGPETENMIFCLLQNTRNLQHTCMQSPILVVKLHAAPKNDSTFLQGEGLTLSAIIAAEKQALMLGSTENNNNGTGLG